MRYSRHALLTIVAVALVACAKPAPPPPDVLVRGMVEALIDTGFYSEVDVTRTIGRHYHPGDDSWTVFACFRFTLPDGSEGTNCMDSFKAMQLDGGDWIVAVTVNDVYRWRAIEVRPNPGPGSETATQPEG